jgi:hypothetical protein
MFAMLQFPILEIKNDILRAKIVELNSCKPSTSIVEHTTICTRCRDVNIDAIHDHMALIKQQNDHIAKLDAKIVEHDLENEKFKFARSMLYNGRREREMCPWAISKYFGDWVPTQVVLCKMVDKVQIKN